jgi:hypothetical protein
MGTRVEFRRLAPMAMSALVIEDVAQQLLGGIVCLFCYETVVLDCGCFGNSMKLKGNLGRRYGCTGVIWFVLPHSHTTRTGDLPREMNGL